MSVWITSGKCSRGPNSEGLSQESQGFPTIVENTDPWPRESAQILKKKGLPETCDFHPIVEKLGKALRSGLSDFV